VVLISFALVLTIQLKRRRMSLPEETPLSNFAAANISASSKLLGLTESPTSFSSPRSTRSSLQRAALLLPGTAAVIKPAAQTSQFQDFVDRVLDFSGAV
jgi:hypothetical protein